MMKQLHSQVTTQVPPKVPIDQVFEAFIWWAAILMIPFISWGEVPLLTGVFVLFVTLALLLRIRRPGKEGVIRFQFTSLWIPLVLVLILGVVHLAWSPAPYSSFLFLIHLSLAAAFYFLLLEGPLPDPLRNPLPGPQVPVLVWTGSLIVWMVVQKLLLGVPSPAGPFSNPNYLATVLLTCLAWFLGTLIPGDKPFEQPDKRPIVQTDKQPDTQPHDQANDRTSWHRPLFFLAALVCTAALAVIGSRSAGLAILVLWGVLGIFGKGRFRFAAVAVVLLLLLVPTTLKDRATGGGSSDPHAFSRLRIWRGALEMGLEYPVMGVGPNLYYEYAPQYAFPTETLPVRYGRIARKPHNEYLRAWAEGGAAGAVAIVLFLFVTFRLFISAWKRDQTGPALVVAVFLFQALFHDLNEVFTLTALGAFWLACLSRGETRTVELRTRAGKGGVVLIGIITLLMALWLNMDVSARVLWLKGQRALSTDAPRGMEILSRALVINPLLPGAARDLAWARLSMYRTWGSQEELESARSAIREARKLNRLDTVPLRMEADLLVEQAARQPAMSRDLLVAAREQLIHALDLEPKNALVMVDLAEMEWELGEGARALQMVDRALKMEPNYLEAHRLRIAYLQEFEPGAVTAAREELDRALGSVEGYQPRSAYERLIVK